MRRTIDMMLQKAPKKAVNGKPYKVRFDFSELIKDVRSEPSAEEVESKIKSKDIIIFQFKEYLWEKMKKDRRKGAQKIEFDMGADPDDETVDAKLIYLEQKLENNFLKSLVSERIIKSVVFGDRQMGSARLEDYDPFWRMNIATVECNISKLKSYLKRQINAGKKMRSRPSYDKANKSILFLGRFVSFRQPLRRKFFECLWANRRTIRDSERGKRIFGNGSIVPLDILAQEINLTTGPSPKKKVRVVLTQWKRDLNKIFKRNRMPLYVDKVGSGFQLTVSEH